MDARQNIPSQRRNQMLSPSRSNRNEKNSGSLPNSPEFEFWSMLRSQPAPDPARILSADELFSDGVLLPLDLSGDPPDSDGTAPPISGQNDAPSGVLEPETRAASLLAPKAEPVTGSKRWMDSFKKSEKTSPPNDQVEYVAALGGKKKEIKEKLERDQRKEKPRRRGSGSPELNIYIWPFSRSRSAGNVGTGAMIPHSAPATRRVSSAPCSRSNSAGDPKSRSSNNGYRWPSSPGRIGVNVSRGSPVWRPKPSGASASAASRGFSASNKNPSTETDARVLNVDAPTLRYASRGRSGCRSIAGGRAIGRGGGGGSLFNLRGLFTKKVHLIK